LQGRRKKEYFMGTGRKFAILVIAVVLCAGGLSAEGSTAHRQRKPKKAQLPPPLPSGPQGPVPQIPLDSIPAVAPQVSYQSGQLTIVAPNSTLGDILRAVRKQTAAEIEIPANANERVVTHLGPGAARDVVAELLNGSRFNYVLLGSASDSTQLTRVVLVAKTSDKAPNVQGQQQPAMSAMTNINMTPPPQDMGNTADAAEPEATEENVDENADQNQAEQNAAEAEQQQQVPPGEQPGIKTPQQMLQEMQQRQLQLQQQQPPGQPPVPGSGYPPVPPAPPQQQ
jgi:hypothetical protein